MEGVVGADPSGLRVLLVDDNNALCRATAAGLARAGYQVFPTFSGADALAQALATPPDVAIVDLIMPTMSGLDVIRALRQEHAEALHIIAATAIDSEDNRLACLEAGCDDFIVKPTTVTDLRMRILLAARRQRAFIEARVARETIERQRTYANEAIALLAHDLRNAIMSCVTTLDLVSEVIELEAEIVDMVRGSTASLRLVSTLVENLLDIGRFEDAAIMPRTSVINVRSLLESVVSLHGASMGTTLGWEIDCDPSLTARFDRSLIERVLHNLVGNARRYAGTGGLVRVIANPWFEIPPDSCEISIENSGPLVVPDMVPRLFSKYGLGPDGKRGLGLYFSRLACEAHGGSIFYQAHDGRPMFVLRLPGTP